MSRRQGAQDSLDLGSAASKLTMLANGTYWPLEGTLSALYFAPTLFLFKGEGEVFRAPLLLGTAYLLAGWSRTGVLEVTCFPRVMEGEEVGCSPPRLSTRGPPVIWCAGTAMKH